MIAAYRTDRACLCEEVDAIQSLADRIAAEHADRSEAEAAAITRAAIRRWRHRDLAAARLRQGAASSIFRIMAAHDTASPAPIPATPE